MNYKKIYTQLILKGQNRVIHEGAQYERHHIVPICMGGEDISVNLVSLTPEEHYIAHLLLIKIYPLDTKLWYAANMMRSRVKSNKEYGWFKQQFIYQMKQDRINQPRTLESRLKQSETCKEKYRKGYVSPRTGAILTEEHKKAISEGNRGKAIPIESRSSLEGYILRYGKEEGTRRYGDDSKKKASNSLEAFIARFGIEEGTKHYEERRRRLSLERTGESNSFFGKKHSNKTKEVLREKAKNRPTVTCPFCGKVGHGTIMKRWHFDKCKFKHLKTKGA